MPTWGSSFKTVVTICIQAAVRMPRQLINTNNHRSESDITGGNQGVVCRDGTRTAR